MKKFVFIIFALFVAACGGKGGSGDSNTVAVTPSDLGCINGSTNCNTAAYANYAGWTTYSLPYGSTQYNYSNYFNQYGFCGCPTGYSPSYNGSMGLGCISNQYLQPAYSSAVFMVFGGGSYYGWGGGGAVNNQPQYSNIAGSANQGICSRNLTQSCLINQANSCGVGATCRQVLNNSALGVCVNPSQQGYNPYGYGYGYSAGGWIGY